MGSSYVNLLTFLTNGTTAVKGKDTVVNLNTVTYLKPLGTFNTRNPRIRLQLFDLYDVGNQIIVITSIDEINNNIETKSVKNYNIERQGRQNVAISSDTFRITGGFNPQKIVQTQALQKNKEGKFVNIDLFEIYYFNNLIMIVDAQGYYDITGGEPTTTTTTTSSPPIQMGYSCTPKGCVGMPGGPFKTAQECENNCAKLA